MKWKKTTVHLENHIIIPDLNPNMNSPEKFVEDYISGLTMTSMDLSKPLWEVHLLNVKTSDAEAVGVFRIHHSMGDGASLISLLLACTRKASDPESLPNVPTKKRVETRNPSRLRQLFLGVWQMLVMLCNTVVDVLLFVATTMLLKDSDTPIKGNPGVEGRRKRIVYRTVSLDDIKLVKNAMSMTVNDVLLGVTQAGLSRYLNRRYGQNKGREEKENNLDKNIRVRAVVLVNIRPTAGIEDLAAMMEEKSDVKWGTRAGYILLRFNIALQEDPLNYVRDAKALIDRKKLSFEAHCQFSINNILLKTFGFKKVGAMSKEVFFNTTMTFSNVTGPTEEISFYGHQMAFLAPTVYGLPHALTMHFQSYVNKMSIVLAVDQSVIPDPHLLCDDLQVSLELIRDAVLKKGVKQDAVYNTC